MDEQELNPATETTETAEVTETTEVVDVVDALDDTDALQTEAFDADPTEPVAATPDPLVAEPAKRRWFAKPIATAALAGVLGLGLGAGAVALAHGIGDGHGDRQMGREHHDERGRRDNGHGRQQGDFMQPGMGGQMQGDVDGN